MLGAAVEHALEVRADLFLSLGAFPDLEALCYLEVEHEMRTLLSGIIFGIGRALLSLGETCMNIGWAVRGQRSNHRNFTKQGR